MEAHQKAVASMLDPQSMSKITVGDANEDVTTSKESSIKGKDKNEPSS